MGLEKTLKAPRTNLNHSILVIFFISWFVIWAIDTWTIISKEKRYYAFAINADLETWRGHYAYDKGSVDFYSIIRECDRLLLSQEKLQVIVPKDDPTRNNYLTEKARYYLYPRNYGENETSQKYALVYGVPDFRIPAGYKIIKRFGIDKYLIENKNALRQEDKQ